MKSAGRQILQKLKLGELKDFTVISFNSESICGCAFTADAEDRWRIAAVSVKRLAGAKDEAVLWRELWHDLHGGSDLIILTGAFPGGVLFGFDAIALAPHEQREALMMELPRQMLRPPENPVLQYLPDGAETPDGMQKLQVYAFARQSMDAVVGMLRRARLSADEFIHPLLTVGKDDPAVFLPALDPEFYFAGGKFHRVLGSEAELADAGARWRAVIEAEFSELPPECGLEEFLPVFLVARFIASGRFRHCRHELKVLPDEVHPVRFRRHLQLTAVLFIALVAVSIWNFSRGRWQELRAYREAAAEVEELKRSTDTMQATLRRTAKEQKDIAKVVNADLGTHYIIGQLAALSRLLPQDVMLTDFRWNENGIDLVLQSESENLDLPGVLRPLSNWKVTDINQRQGRFSATTTVTAKLVPVEKSKSAKGKDARGNARKGAKR